MLKSSKSKKLTNPLVIKLRRKQLIRKIIVMLIILIIAVGVFITKSDVFIVKKVVVLGNPIMSGDDVKKNTEYLLGQNIFFINKNDIIKEAKKNPYVESVEITKTYPKQVNIEVTEKTGTFYIEKENSYYILNGDAQLLEKTDNIDNRNLIKLSGINSFDDVNLGDKISDNARIIYVLKTFSEIAKVNPSNYKIDSIDMSDLLNIKVYIGDVEGRLGNDENIPEKMNKFLHIVESTQIEIKKGYVDVGFAGAPVYYKEN